MGHSWKREFDEQGLISNQTNPNGETTRYQYNSLGLVNSLVDPLNRQWNFVWDNHGKLIARKDPQGNHTRYTYDAWGELLKITWPDNQISEYRYDNNGKCTAIKHPDGKHEQFAYNELGLMSGHKDSAGRTTHYEYNGLSQVVKRIDPNGQVLHYHYDGERNLIGLTNEKGERYQLDYDLNERLVQEIGFDGRVQRYNYNAAGHLESAQDFARNGRELVNQIDFVRRADGRMLKQVDAQNQTTLNEFDYDAAGRLTQAKNPARELRWSYDPLGRTLEDWQDQQIIRHTYNAAGERTQTQLPNGEKINYSYNANSQFTGLAFNQKTVVAIAHDSMGRELKRMLGNKLETESRYDPQGRLVAQRTGKRTQDSRFAPISQRSFHYNDAGQLAQIDDQLRGSTRYHYDALDRLTQVDGPNPETFVHDPAGNILGNREDAATSENQPSQGNRLAFYGDSHYSYDERGNRVITARGKQQKLQQRMSYNALNQLESVENKDLTTQYQYDALGRRISKHNTQNRTEFLWLDNTLLSETTTQLAEQTQTAKIYLFEPGTHKPLAVAQNDELYHYHLDHLGTPQEITNAQGQLAWSANYKAYGNLALVQNHEIENNLRFQGQYFDEETGLHYNRFRYYDPECGRFISQDPIGLLGGVNNYQYVPNPVGWIDPLGLSCKEQKYTSTPLLNEYVGEADSNNPSRWNSFFGDDVVCEYLDENQRKAYEVTVDNGLLAYKGGPNKGQLVDTRNMSSLHSSNPSAIFVMSSEGSIYLGSHGQPGSFHHSSFLAGSNVASAGEMVVHDGKIVEVSNTSGHYKPAQSLNDQIFTELDDKGMSKSDIGNITRTGISDSGKPMSPMKQRKVQEAAEWKPGDSIPYDWDDF
jgi:RHS repeat-associated protein